MQSPDSDFYETLLPVDYEGHEKKRWKNNNTILQKYLKIQHK